MIPFSSRALKQTAAQRLSEASYSPKKLILLHAGISLAITLAAMVVAFLLSHQINVTGGLSGMDLRAMLSTIQSMLQLGATIVLPFWEIGFLRAALSIGRNQPADPPTLLEGFRRFGPVLRLMLLRGVLFGLLMMVCIYAGTGIFLVTPAATPYVEAMLPLLEELSVLNPELAMDEATMAALMETLWPAYLISGVLFIAVSIPLSYRLRLCEFAILDDPRVGALFAIVKSWKMTKRNCLKLFRLDLSFWWFYALQLLLTALAYLDMILPALGITLPAHAYLWFYLLYGAGLLGLYWWSGSQLHTTYALAYDKLQEAAQMPSVPPAPKHQPWDYR